jgi:hypothetical protein
MWLKDTLINNFEVAAFEEPLKNRIELQKKLV